MSKIYEALQRVQGNLDGATLSDAQDTPHPQLRPLVEDEPASRRESSSIRVLPLRVPLSAPLFPFDADHWYAGEQYKIIRTKINQHPSRPKLIMVSSAGSADGKSITAINIAAALSLKDDTDVLLMDGDFRRSTIYLQLGLPPGPGLLDVLAGSTALEAALIQAERFPNLYVLPAGEPRNNPAELLDSSRWTNLATKLRKAFHYVVVDAPPIAAVADYDLILAKSDALLVVARPDHTNRKALFRALEAVDKDKFLGVVLNYVPDWFLGGSRSYYSYQEYRGQVGQP
ncbi:MAG TPA: CpsD/CapB family tyrosine-protein kinase [Candidatus Acidoferrales bacterium]|jgi:protein-tyrosine kinase|nr:CpsD/CapB family tyrosine-protein kinase [Candidatus Acidoferrales bacterium]